ncbi:hypothetical protein [Streptomyces sp. NPDC058758]|uniref:hypothetical protein n=1 Tax=Streptomyces sp. NPDC058758 TaxID=3346627 RepID=UPI0036AED330
MVASHKALPASEARPDHGERPKSRRWKNPDPAAVAARTAELVKISRHKDRHRQIERLAPHLVKFLTITILPWEKRPANYEVEALAFRSPELARTVRPTLAAIAREPEKYLPQGPEEPNKHHRNRITELRSRAQVEDRLVYRVLAAEAAQRGVFLPEFNARGRARKRLADEYPERFLELVREEEDLQAEKNEAERHKRATVRRADRTPS